jgi:hypothetical protein
MPPKPEYTKEQLERLAAAEIASKKAAREGPKAKRVKRKQTAAEEEAAAKANVQRLEAAALQELESRRARFKAQKVQQQGRQQQQDRGPSLPQRAAGGGPRLSQQQLGQHAAQPDSTFEQDLQMLSAVGVEAVMELDSRFRGGCCGQFDYTT